MKKAIVSTAEHVHAYRAAITLALLCGSGLCVLFYAMNLYTLISRTVAVRQAESQVADLSSQISALDSQYLSLTSAITPDTLAAHGFAPGKVTAYIRLDQPTAVALAGHEL